MAISPLWSPRPSADAPRDDVASFMIGQQAGVASLTRCRAALGRAGDELVHSVLADARLLIEVAAVRGRPATYVGARLRECLETLAELLEQNDRPHWRLPHGPPDRPQRVV